MYMMFRGLMLVRRAVRARLFDDACGGMCIGEVWLIIYHSNLVACCGGGIDGGVFSIVVYVY